MKAIQVSTIGSPSVLKITSVALPSTLDSEILVKNAYSGVNFIDTYHRSGLYTVTLPFIPGREGSGIISSLGSAVRGFSVGDRVAYTAGATYAEFTSVSASSCVKLADNIDLKVGAALLLQGLTAMALTKLAHCVGKDDVVLVHAAAGMLFVSIVVL